MNYKYMYMIGAFAAGIAITLLLAPKLGAPKRDADSSVALPNDIPTPEQTVSSPQVSASQHVLEEQEKVSYTSHITGNETRYGGARISNTEITGNLAVHGGLTAYNIKAYAGTINGGATITNGVFQDMLTIHGGLTGRNITTDAMKILGAASLHNTNITTTLNVNGGLSAQALRARAAQVHGGAVIIDGHLREQLRVTGTANLIDSDIPEIILYAPRLTSWFSWLVGSSNEHKPVLTLQQSRVQNMSIITDNQVNIRVKVAQESTVDTIRFSGKPGIVILDESSTVNSVINGTIQADKNQ